MKRLVTYPLTYFTNRTKDELDEVLEDLSTILPKGEIVNLFVEKFNPDLLYKKYKIALTDKLINSVKKTLQYAIDTELMIRYISNKLDRGNEE